MDYYADAIEDSIQAVRRYGDKQGKDVDGIIKELEGIIAEKTIKMKVGEREYAPTNERLYRILDYIEEYGEQSEDPNDVNDEYSTSGQFMETTWVVGNAKYLITEDTDKGITYSVERIA